MNLKDQSIIHVRSTDVTDIVLNDLIYVTDIILNDLTDVTDIINWHLISINHYLINIRFVMSTTVNFLQFNMNHA
jgi:hypothetical protein